MINSKSKTLFITSNINISVFKITILDVRCSTELILSALLFSQGLKMSSPKNKDSFMYVTEDGEVQLPVEDADRSVGTANQRAWYII